MVLGVCSSVMPFVWWTASRLFPKSSSNAPCHNSSIPFIPCYRWGLPINRRSINIVKCFVVVAVAVISQYFFRSLWYKCRVRWCQEYHEQDICETTKALEGLRKKRPVTKLNDRLSFAVCSVEGASDLKDDVFFNIYDYRNWDDDENICNGAIINAMGNP
uniref:Uncharacterized protein n=1 Tax=Glossina pallidipes TaxID=7398 RepID=A0A1A9ZUZ5_GLOPL